jgi:hypothetical protein
VLLFVGVVVIPSGVRVSSKVMTIVRMQLPS